MGGKSGVKANGCGANRGGRKVTEMEIDYYISSVGVDATKLPATSLKFRQKNEQTRQSTAENRLFGLHFSAYPHALNEGSLTPRTKSEQESTSSSLIPLASTSESAHEIPSLCRLSPRVAADAKTYPSLRSTNQVFNDVVTQSKQRLIPRVSVHDALNQDVSTLPPQLAYAATYNQSWTAGEKAEVRAARKLPYDSTLNSVLGRPKTVYREEFCRKAPPSEFRDQILNAGNLNSDTTTDDKAAASPRRPGTARAALAGDSEHLMTPLRIVKVGTNSANGEVKLESWICESKLVAPPLQMSRASSARVIPRPPKSSPRKRLEVASANPASPRIVERDNGDSFILLPRSYFSNRAKYTAM
jgi:hypothetical protein